MFTMSESAELIRQGIQFAEASTKPFVISRVMKSVGMLELANLISREFGDGSKPEIVGIRPGETLNETLVSQQELPYAYYSKDKRYILLHSDEFGQQRVTEPLSSLTADYMTEKEMSALYASYAAPAVAAVQLSSTQT
jgi:FlaA1/EpsC-like NDP-sugar epimerase